MALVLKDRVRETTITTGTGAVTLAGAVTGFQSFSAIGSGNSCYYCIADRTGANWEVGIGAYNSIGNTLYRNTVLSSSNSGALVSFGAGTKDVFVTQPSEKAVYLDINNRVGIGTNAPDYPLEVRTASETYGIAHSDGTHVLSTYVGSSGVSIGSDTNDPLILKTYDTEQMRIDTAGNVGIGTLNPTTKLDVVGGITGTTITANTAVALPGSTVGNAGIGTLQMLDGGDGYDYLNIWTDDGGGIQLPVAFPGGLSAAGNISAASFTAPVFTASGDGTNSGQIQVYDPSGALFVTVTVPTSFSSYTLTLPSTAGSANQVLKTNGTGVTSWTTVDPLTLTGISDPSAPSNTNTTIYSKSFGGNVAPTARNALNRSFAMQAALWSKNVHMWTCTNSTGGSWLNSAGNSAGTFTAVTPTTGSTLYQTIRRSTYANLITTTNQVLGVNSLYLSFFRGSVASQGGFFFYTRCGFDVWTNGGRFFAGMALNNTTIVSNDPSSNNNTVGFCVDAADNGAISFLTRGTAATKASTGYTITSTKGYELYIYCAPNSSQYTWMITDINAGTSATGTATLNLPTNTQTQQPTVLASNAALTPATSISLGIAKIYCESDY